MSHSGPHDVPFLDGPTAAVIEWADIWRMYQPVTPYGKQLKASTPPFRPGDEAACQLALQQLAADVTGLSAADVSRLRAVLLGVPDVTETLARLQTSDLPLKPRQLLELKQLLAICRALTHEPAAQGLHWAMTVWDDLLDCFGDDDLPSFSLDHVGGHAYQEASRAVAAAAGRQARAQRDRDNALLAAVGKRPDRDGKLRFHLPGERDLAERLKSAAAYRLQADRELAAHAAADALSVRLEWLQDTPFESVFQVHPTPDMALAADLLASAKAALDDVTEKILRDVTDGLRVRIREWRSGLDRLAALDVRLAKVQFCLDIQGSVPAVGDAWTLRDGFHVPVGERLHRQGRTFTPLNVQFAPGVSVICGSNMGGKTVAMMTASVCQALLQYALPVPAAQFTAPLVDAVRFCESTTSDAGNGLSSFGAEVARLREVWTTVRPLQRVLLCIDEPGRSTNPVEGEALAVGLVRACAARSGQDWRVLMATHFTAPAMEPDVHRLRVRGLHTRQLPEFPEDMPLTGRLQALEQAMDYALEPWADGDLSQEAIHVAAWLGLPDALLEETQRFLRRRKPE